MEKNNNKIDDSTNTVPERWTLRLYVAGQSPNSLTALANLKRLCEQNLDPDTYEIEVIDLLKNPHLADSDQIVAIPTLVRLMPAPIKKIIGDLSNGEKVQVILQIPTSK